MANIMNELTPDEMENVVGGITPVQKGKVITDIKDLSGYSSYDLEKALAKVKRYVTNGKPTYTEEMLQFFAEKWEEYRYRHE